MQGISCSKEISTSYIHLASYPGYFAPYPPNSLYVTRSQCQVITEVTNIITVHYSPHFSLCRDDGFIPLIIVLFFSVDPQNCCNSVINFYSIEMSNRHNSAVILVRYLSLICLYLMVALYPGSSPKAYRYEATTSYIEL